MQRFLKDAIPNPEDQETYWQYLGYCMTTDTGFQKFMMIKGPGSTGKSVVVDLTENTVGLQNSVSISIQDLNKRFYATSLFGKLLNACADIPSTALQSIDVLKKAVDPTKDQSYVLYSLTQEQLGHVRFPLGGLTKNEVRRIAQENGFVNASKPDSQDICFVPDGDYAGFIERYSGASSGGL